jgi:hypothetical protein
MSALDAALAYANLGWRVFPCYTAGPRRKTPRIEGWQARATTDPATITGWWRHWPKALIGTPTGRAFVVLDIDPRHGGDKTIAVFGYTTLPATPTVQTAGGGWHLYFEPPDPPIGITAGDPGPGLDWRGVGGLVILPAPGTG